MIALMTHRKSWYERLRRYERLCSLRQRRRRLRGPHAVAASLQRGLTAARLPHFFDPRRLGGEVGAVGVLSDLGAVAEAVAWRRGEADRKLLVGPNVVVMPSEARRLLTSPEIDSLVVPSEWVKGLYEADVPELEGRIAVWPAGVDTDYWRPASGGAPERAGAERPHALVYVKEIPGQPNATDDEVSGAQRALADAGFSSAEVRYGSYAAADYLRALQGADLLVAFSPSESQGVALLEAWAADVPSMIWARGEVVIDGRTYKSSSAPYLTSSTGAEFHSVDELRELLGTFASRAGGRFAPREWVLKTMTDEICARQYWDLAHG